MEHYDIGVLGVWYGFNYGSVLTYYALHKALTDLGKSVLMIDKINAKHGDTELALNHARRFASEHYAISSQYQLGDLKKLNQYCDTFLTGSDQLWNYGISKAFGKAFYLDFADDDKRKIAYATSFGHAVDFAPDEERPKISRLLKRFNAISVREADGIRLCKDVYGVNAIQVLDPVFLFDAPVYSPLAEKAKYKPERPYIFTYILDPTPEKREALLHVSSRLQLPLVNILDGVPAKFEENKAALALDGTLGDIDVYDFCYLFANANFVITDSCHGCSFAIINRKPFIAIGNRRRGMSRFQSLFSLLY
jgi:hypothetical protein